jgi:hypothetical protein
MVNTLSGRVIDFPESKIKDISKFIRNKLNLHNISTSKSVIQGKSITINTGKLNGISRIDIISFEDEWFLISYYRNLHKNAFKSALSKILQILDSGNIDAGSRIDKCDTLDGVKQSLLNYKNSGDNFI